MIDVPPAQWEAPAIAGFCSSSASGDGRTELDVRKSDDRALAASFSAFEGGGRQRLSRIEDDCDSCEIAATRAIGMIKLPGAGLTHVVVPVYNTGAPKSAQLGERPKGPSPTLLWKK